MTIPDCWKYEEKKPTEDVSTKMIIDERKNKAYFDVLLNMMLCVKV